MKEVSFIFRGKSYKGFIAASTDEYPHFYWCFLDDPDLVEDVGDCLSFKKDQEGQLKPTELYPKQYEDLVQTIQAIVEQGIAANSFAQH